MLVQSHWSRLCSTLATRVHLAPQAHQPNVSRNLLLNATWGYVWDQHLIFINQWFHDFQAFGTATTTANTGFGAAPAFGQTSAFGSTGKISLIFISSNKNLIFCLIFWRFRHTSRVCSAFVRWIRFTGCSRDNSTSRFSVWPTCANTTRCIWSTCSTNDWIWIG